MSLNYLKEKPEAILTSGVPSPSEPKTSKPPEEKMNMSSDKKERFDKIDIVLHQYYYAINDSSMQELVYLNWSLAPSSLRSAK